jgi:pyruvate ferredoxin oxidoreductase gamma subunit
VPNTALLSAFLELTGLLPRAALVKALGQRFHGTVLENNRQLVERAAAQVPGGAWQEDLHEARA